MKIEKINVTSIKDSRGKPTIQVQINGQKASSPSGTSTGKYETNAFNKNHNHSIQILKKKIPKLKKVEINSFLDLKNVEKILSKKAGANTLFSLECSILKALAKSNKQELWQTINPNAIKFPVPVGNIIGGGRHSQMYKSHPIFQEFEIIPKHKSPKKNLQTLEKIFSKVKKILKTNKLNYEGTLQTTLNNEEILSLLYQQRKKIDIGLDLAANSFYKNSNYNYHQKTLDRKAQIFYVNSLIKKYNLRYIEDPLNEEDFLGFSKITKSKKHLVVGDDLTATQISRIMKAIKLKSINALIIKPNQNGSLLDLFKIFQICRKNNIKTILSHRSGETLDNALADLAFGFQADFIKAGISTRYRQVKLKRLVEIEKSIKKV